MSLVHSVHDTCVKGNKVSTENSVYSKKKKIVKKGESETLTINTTDELLMYRLVSLFTGSKKTPHPYSLLTNP